MKSGDSTCHCWSPTPTLNGCDLTQKTQSSEQEYSYLTASKRHPSNPYYRNNQSFSRGTRPYTFTRSTEHVYKSLACCQDFSNLLESDLFCSATAATKSALGSMQLWFNYFRGILAYTLIGTLGGLAEMPW